MIRGRSSHEAPRKNWESFSIAPSPTGSMWDTIGNPQGHRPNLHLESECFLFEIVPLLDNPRSQDLRLENRWLEHHSNDPFCGGNWPWEVALDSPRGSNNFEHHQSRSMRVGDSWKQTQNSFERLPHNCFWNVAIQCQRSIVQCPIFVRASSALPHFLSNPKGGPSFRSSRFEWCKVMKIKTVVTYWNEKWESTKRMSNRYKIKESRNENANAFEQ